VIKQDAQVEESYELITQLIGAKTEEWGLRVHINRLYKKKKPVLIQTFKQIKKYNDLWDPNSLSTFVLYNNSTEETALVQSLQEGSSERIEKEQKKENENHQADFIKDIKVGHPTVKLDALLNPKRPPSTPAIVLPLHGITIILTVLFDIITKLLSQ
jgi:hypothetical protein